MDDFEMWCLLATFFVTGIAEYSVVQSVLGTSLHTKVIGIILVVATAVIFYFVGTAGITGEGEPQ